MKTYFNGFFICLVFFISCKKEEFILSKATVVTKEATDIFIQSNNSVATFNGEVVNEGSKLVTERGFVYSKNENPSVSDSKIVSGFGIGTFNSKIQNLEKNSKYFFRSFAKNEIGLAYGDTKSFTAADNKTPTVNTKAVTILNNTYVSLSGELIENGGLDNFEIGFVVGLKPNADFSNSIKVTVFNSTFQGFILPFIVQLKLAANKKYYIRAFAINEKGTAFGSELQLNTPSSNPNNFGTITSTRTGRIWMDRNLGALQVATNINDAMARGDLYQWGRQADGHEIRVSETTTTLSTSDNPQNGLFIISGVKKDWKVNSNNNLWQPKTNLNNVCPVGFRVPTIDEFRAEGEGVIKYSDNGTEMGELKLPSTGIRNSDGSNYYPLNSNIVNLNYWTSSVFDNDYVYSLTKDYYNRNSNLSIINPKSQGLPVRCIKD